MERVAVNGIELEAEMVGSGEPVLLIHGGFTPAWQPLLREPVLTERYRLINYHRRNFAGSTHASNTNEDHLADALALLRHYGVERAHVAGHGGSGNMALRLALDAPDVVHSLLLLEAAVPAPEEVPLPSFEGARQAEAKGDWPGMVREFLQAAMGEGYDAWDRGLPAGWFEQAVADQAWIRGHNPPPGLPITWSPEVAQRITQPALLVLGDRSFPWWRERHEHLLRSLPHAEPFVLAGATHALQFMNPRGLAEGLVAFMSRHPMS